MAKREKMFFCQVSLYTYGEEYHCSALSKWGETLNGSLVILFFKKNTGSLLSDKFDHLFLDCTVT